MDASRADCGRLVVQLRSRTYIVFFLFLVLLITSGAIAEAADRPAESKFLLISDIHFNPMADARLVSELAAADPAQWEPILDRTSPGGFSQYGSDTNWWLLKSTLKQFPATLPHPALVMVTGDLLAHNFPKTYQSVTHDTDLGHYRSFVNKTVKFLAIELQREFPGVRILLTPGNNDNDCGNYSVQAGGTFLNDTAPITRELADGDYEFTRAWKALGSFNVPHPTLPDVRIISFNSILFSQKYSALSFSHACAQVSSTAAADLIAWLERNLGEAAQANQRVWLMFHIPPGIDGYASSASGGSQNQGAGPATSETCRQAIVPMWVPKWTEQFDALLAKYHSTIIASFAGHTHSDDFRLIGPAGAAQEFVLIGPAISPVYNQNPGFRVVSYSRNGAVKDQSTYYLTNLKAASSRLKGRWKREYTFTRKWKVRELDAASLSNVYTQVVENEPARAGWLKLYAVSGPAEHGDKSIVRGLYCAVESLTEESYKECSCTASQKP